MVIRRPDGTPYCPTGQFKQFDPENQVFDLFNRYDQELISIGGIPIFYYEVFIPMNTIDPLYLESRGKFWSQNPIELQAVYEPVQQQYFLNTFGVDGPDEVVFYLNYRDVLDRIGHPPRIGSRIFTPHKRENWEIKDRKTTDFYKWGEMRLEIYCDRFRENLTTGEGKVTQPEIQPKFEIN